MLRFLQKFTWLLVLVGMLAGSAVRAAVPPTHPNLLITAADVPALKQGLSQYPLLEKSYQAMLKTADKALAAPIAVPVPKDPAGGYTHEQHQRNYYALQAAGVAYQLTQDAKYARFVRDVLLEYSKLVPTLKNHPEAKSSSPGRLFWQALNDANWLVYSIQGYDAVYETLTPAERKQIEDGAFRPLCNYFTQDLKSWFDLVHNHGVWAAAGVGMVGYALHDAKLVNMALRGTNGDGKSGFLAQLNGLFSPDGYYTEGPYYSRYALSPFFQFAQAIDHNQPELKIFQYRDNILQKALRSSLQLTNNDGRYYPLNDALKEKDWITQELVGAVSIAAQHYGVDPSLLGVVQLQKKVLVTLGGLEVAKAAAATKTPPTYQRLSQVYRDGATGTAGGLAVLRSGPQDEQTALLLKYTGHGLSHGHYDKLGIVLYDRGREILQDYGAVRYLNVEAKEGGRYLPETKTWAGQTIAHNALVVDEASHFGGQEAVSEQNSGTAWFADISQPGKVQVASAKANTAYAGVQMQRTVALFRDSVSGKLLALDVLRVQADQPHQYDLPYYYQGQLMETSFPYASYGNGQQPLGRRNGYQHLWKEASSKPFRTPGPAALTWLQGGQFYTLTTAADTATHLVLTRIGAGDPNFNLRPEPGLVLREKGQNHVFASVVEAHGDFNPTAETATNSHSNVQQVLVLADSPEATVVEVQLRRGGRYRLAVANQDAAAGKTHEMTVGGQSVKWQGPYWFCRLSN